MAGYCNCLLAGKKQIHVGEPELIDFSLTVKAVT